jgi:hypothetical protein
LVCAAEGCLRVDEPACLEERATHGRVVFVQHHQLIVVDGLEIKQASDDG